MNLHKKVYYWMLVLVGAATVSGIMIFKLIQEVSSSYLILFVAVGTLVVAMAAVSMAVTQRPVLLNPDKKEIFRYYGKTKNGNLVLSRKVTQHIEAELNGSPIFSQEVEIDNLYRAGDRKIHLDEGLVMGELCKAEERRNGKESELWIVPYGVSQRVEKRA